MTQLKAYQVQADGWAEDRFESLRKQRNILGASLVLSLLAVTSMGFALAALAPMKSSEPYLLVHDKSTGQIHQMTRLRDDPTVVQQLQADDAVVSSYLVPYIVARESYDKTDAKARAETVQIFSAPNIFSEYQDLHRSSDAALNPYLRYRDDKVAVEVKSVAFINRTTAQVRFAATWKKAVGQSTTHHVATIGFRFVNTPQQMNVRWRNPLGFQATNYRVDQEVINNG